VSWKPRSAETAALAFIHILKLQEALRRRSFQVFASIRLSPQAEGMHGAAHNTQVADHHAVTSVSLPMQHTSTRV
jgi:hypothetical protein